VACCWPIAHAANASRYGALAWSNRAADRAASSAVANAYTPAGVGASAAFRRTGHGIPASTDGSTPDAVNGDKFIQLAIAGQVVGLAAAWVEDAFARTGLRFIPVIDIEPAVTAVAWHPRSLTPLAERLLTIAGQHSPHGAGLAS